MEPNGQQGVTGFAELLELAKVLHLAPHRRKPRKEISLDWDVIRLAANREREIGL